MGTTIWSPLASGVLTDKYLKQLPDDTRFGIAGLEWLKERNLTEERLLKVKALNDLALELGTSLAKLSIAWTIKNPNVSTAILGASKVEQLDETLDSLSVVPMITEEIELKIEEILKNKPEFPQF